jgi:hypothetical protein
MHDKPCEHAKNNTSNGVTNFTANNSENKNATPIIHMSGESASSRVRSPVSSSLAHMKAWNITKGESSVQKTEKIPTLSSMLSRSRKPWRYLPAMHTYHTPRKRTMYMRNEQNVKHGRVVRTCAPQLRPRPESPA